MKEKRDGKKEKREEKWRKGDQRLLLKLGSDLVTGKQEMEKNKKEKSMVANLDGGSKLHFDAYEGIVYRGGGEVERENEEGKGVEEEDLLDANGGEERRGREREARGGGV
uniref:Uncharacterized protein n=1 Tax=Nelumbo nucifera TaxID=4432 RepID=A0A822YX53_NELNU|nr:TPA_asm: hypothetical protein HUJ06_007903 [Nelumbo nucifera]